MISELVSFILGAFLSYIIDVTWWNLDFKKAEKGLEAHEHYHVGLELLIAALLVYRFINPTTAYILIGAGFGFITAEWRQTVEIAGKKVKPGHPFAYGSNHFKQSTVIGIILTAILATTALILP